MDTKKLVTVVIPAYKAQTTIRSTLASIQMQSIKDNIDVIISNDDPNDNDYKDIINSYPELSIEFIDTDKNTGPGLARQRGLDKCNTPLITFIDADDVFYDMYSLEKLVRGIQSVPNCIECRGSFIQRIPDVKGKLSFNSRNEVTHPWVFGIMYNAQFLKTNGISFPDKRIMMEDGEFNWKIRMTIEGSHLSINVINDPVYIWREGSDHSITRIGIDEKGIPQYNFDLCQVGATSASINAIKFCKSKNPFNGNINKFCTEMMIGQYFTYIECLGRKPIFARQNLWNAKRFYNECYREIESQISDEILKNMYTIQLAAKSASLVGIIPEITFFDFMKLIKESEFSYDELKEIREELPRDIIDNDIKCGACNGDGSLII